jgi:transcriptional regulator with XRE-family HTH domain
MQSDGEYVNEIPRMSEFAARLRDVRREAGLSQEGFGALGGVSRNAQFTYESGTRYPDVAYLLGLSTAGIDINYLLTGRRAASMLEAEETQVLDRFRALDGQGRQLVLEVLARMVPAP